MFLDNYFMGIADTEEDIPDDDDGETLGDREAAPDDPGQRGNGTGWSNPASCCPARLLGLCCSARLEASYSALTCTMWEKWSGCSEGLG